MRLKTSHNFDFFGTVISETAPSEFEVSQKRHVNLLPMAPKDCNFEEFRKFLAILAWLANSHPELCCLINRAAQVTSDTFSKSKIHEFNKAVNLVEGGSVLTLKYKRLDSDSMRLKMYADAAFATNDELSSQLGYIIILTDKTGTAHVLEYSSKKSEMVIGSTIGGEFYASAYGFERSFILRRDVQLMPPLHCFTDLKQLFDSIPGQLKTERRLMIDIMAAREAYEGIEVTQLGLVSSDDNPVDGLSKVKDNGALAPSLESGIDTCAVQQWIMRKNEDSEQKMRECKCRG